MNAFTFNGIEKLYREAPKSHHSLVRKYHQGGQDQSSCANKMNINRLHVDLNSCVFLCWKVHILAGGTAGDGPVFCYSTQR